MAEQLAAMQAQLQALKAFIDLARVPAAAEQAAAEQAAAEQAAAAGGGAEAPPLDPHSPEPQHDQQDDGPAHGTSIAAAESAEEDDEGYESAVSTVSDSHEKPPELAVVDSSVFLP